MSPNRTALPIVFMLGSACPTHIRAAAGLAALHSPNALREHEERCGFAGRLVDSPQLSTLKHRPPPIGELPIGCILGHKRESNGDHWGTDSDVSIVASSS